MKFSLHSALCLTVVLVACGSSSTRNSVKLVSDIINKNEANYSLNLHIPQVKGLQDEAVQKDINTRLENIATTKEKELGMQDMSDDPNTPGKGSLGIDYTAKTLSQSWISILLSIDTYVEGAAHPNTNGLSFLYDVTSKKELKLEDLFNTKTKYLERLSELSIPQLIATSKKNGTYFEAKEQMIREGAGPKKENFDIFAIENGNLVFFFDPYQVGPYAEGMQTVTLPRADITDVLSNEGRKILSETEKKS